MLVTLIGASITPEPASLALMLTGIAMITMAARRRRFPAEVID